MTTAYLGLGANLGDRRRTIERALDELAAMGIGIAARSPMYETDPVAPDAQPAYLNAAARVETNLSARALLYVCLDVERALGRVRPAGRPAAPRAIDIDLLLYGDAIIDEPPILIVPHPRLLERAFVRIPLADVALPGLVHPATREPLDRAAPAASVRRAEAAE
ncbi:MAG TPA: 2-amino-4-hydroxy-6-hydroxymethyldihydropteridine diphosphokinase [Polyangia bacterium]|nr:2-amino-4-hydroxy-6-hydroxymethyldihydropteridine diphosphokinase [Polyangia bacterium]